MDHDPHNHDPCSQKEGHQGHGRSVVLSSADSHTVYSHSAYMSHCACCNYSNPTQRLLSSLCLRPCSNVFLPLLPCRTGARRGHQTAGWRNQRFKWIKLTGGIRHDQTQNTGKSRLLRSPACVFLYNTAPYCNILWPPQITTMESSLKSIEEENKVIEQQN